MLTENTADAAKPSTLVRDNTTFKAPFNLDAFATIVLVDNAGIGGTSDVEVTWKLSDTECRVVTFGGTISDSGDGGDSNTAGRLLTNDGAFGALASHADVSGTNAILLVSEDGACEMLADEYVTVSTVGAN